MALVLKLDEVKVEGHLRREEEGHERLGGNDRLVEVQKGMAVAETIRCHQGPDDEGEARYPLAVTFRGDTGSGGTHVDSMA